MTLLYYDDCFLNHDTGRHPESSERLVRITRHLKKTDLWDEAARRPVLAADRDTIAYAHDAQYVDRMRSVAESGGGRVETDTVVSAGSFAAAERAVGAACDATRRVLTGESKRAFCMVRPPGHHALYAAPMGFCLFNNVAVAARLATRQLGVNRLLIVDWDVHHGNGTQDCFWEDEQVGFFSIHRFPFYPGSGAADETGGAAGLGYTHNVPVEFGSSRADYRKRLESSLTTFCDLVRPELILLSAGFDAHRLDPVGSLGLETEDFADLTRLVVQIADVHAQGRIVSLLEGGYNVDVLPLCVEQHLRTLETEGQSELLGIVE